MHFSSPHISVVSPEVANYHSKGLTDNCLKRQVPTNTHTTTADRSEYNITAYVLAICCYAGGGYINENNQII